MTLAGEVAQPAVFEEPSRSPEVVTSMCLGRIDMFKGGLLWLIGIPIPIILVIWFLGYL